ncbi:MAG: hypothetical protein LBD20_05755 [Spirochaetaceae bacterium]|jgi:hypothetical protein|nr:hypothetical protein [Spirochaetaceae bacterium]
MGIGTQSESTLHRELKLLDGAYTGKTEVECGGFVCDAYRDTSTIVEVQLGSFAPLAKKIDVLCETHRLVVVHPIVVKKEIHLFDVNQNLVSKKWSSRRGSEWDVFRALLHAPLLPLNVNLTIELALVDVVETRIEDGSGSRRRNGARTADRRLAAYHGSACLAGLADYRRFIPFLPSEKWTAAALAQKAKIRRSLAHKAIYVLSRLALIQSTEKQGRARLWEWSSAFVQ